MVQALPQAHPSGDASQLPQPHVNFMWMMLMWLIRSLCCSMVCIWTEAPGERTM